MQTETYARNTSYKHEVKKYNWKYVFRWCVGQSALVQQQIYKKVTT